MLTTSPCQERDYNGPVSHLTPLDSICGITTKVKKFGVLMQGNSIETTVLILGIIGHNRTMFITE